MKKYILVTLFLISSIVRGQVPAYGDGEWFKFRVHYGIVTAGYATLEVKETTLREKRVYHVKGFGETVGLSKLFFKVRDDYQSYIDVEKNIPYRFIRDIYEGGYTKDLIVDFDHQKKRATVNDKKHNEVSIFSFEENTQDILSSFYYLRNHIDAKKLKENEVVDVNMFFDKENIRFQMRFLGRETISTSFGQVNTLVFRPYVQSGRVFKEKESLTVWISDDKNKIPLLVKANLAVGSLRATLTEYKGLKHPFEVQK